MYSLAFVVTPAAPRTVLAVWVALGYSLQSPQMQTAKRPLRFLVKALEFKTLNTDIINFSYWGPKWWNIYREDCMAPSGSLKPFTVAQLSTGGISWAKVCISAGSQNFIADAACIGSQTETHLGMLWTLTPVEGGLFLEHVGKSTATRGFFTPLLGSDSWERPLPKLRG